jgi:hypothetical protein
VINVVLDLLKNHLLPNVRVTMQALPRPLLLEIDNLLPYKLLLLLEIDRLLPYEPYLLPQLQLRPSSYTARIAKTTMKPLLQEKNKLIYDVGTGLLLVMVKTVLLHHP